MVLHLTILIAHFGNQLLFQIQFFDCNNSFLFCFYFISFSFTERFWIIVGLSWATDLLDVYFYTFLLHFYPIILIINFLQTSIVMTANFRPTVLLYNVLKPCHSFDQLNYLVWHLVKTLKEVTSYVVSQDKKCVYFATVTVLLNSFLQTCGAKFLFLYVIVFIKQFNVLIWQGQTRWV